MPTVRVSRRVEREARGWADTMIDRIGEAEPS